MMDLFGKVKEMQAKLQEAQAGLVHLTTIAESGGGMVKAEVNGLKQLIRLEVDPTLLTPQDQEMMQDLVVAAVNKALEDIDDKVKDTLKKSTEGLLPNIPGLNLNL